MLDLKISVSMVRRGWPLLVIAGLSLAVIVIGGDQKEVSEYRVVTDWSYGPFLSSLIGHPESWAPGFGYIIATRSRDGTLYVAWTELGDFHTHNDPTIVVRKGRDGLTWSEAEEIHPDIEAVGYGNGISLFEDSSGKMWLAWAVMAKTRGSFPHQIWVSVKDNASVPWSKLRPVTRTEDWYWNGTTRKIFDCWRPAFAESNGTVYVYWLSNKNYERGWIWRSGSRDGGFTWSEPSLMEDSPHYQAFFQASDGSLWIGVTEYGIGETVWVMESDDLGYNWSEKKMLGAGAHPRISQVRDRIYVTWQYNRYSPIVTETSLRGANGEPYVWEIQTMDIWFSTMSIGEEGSWSQEAKLLERDSQEDHGGILLETAEGGVVLVYVTSEGLADQYGDPPHQWRVRTAINQEPTEPLPIKKYKEKRLEGVVIE